MESMGSALFVMFMVWMVFLILCLCFLRGCRRACRVEERVGVGTDVASPREQAAALEADAEFAIDYAEYTRWREREGL